MAATLSMIKDGSKVSYGTVSATFSPIGGGKAANGAKSASFANLFSSFKSITKTLAYEAFAMTPAGGIYDTLKQYNDGQLSGLMAIAMLGMNAVPGGAVVKRVVGKVGTTIKRIHKNSLSYIGKTHVYRIKSSDGTFKIGESARGLRKRDGASLRAEQQARKLTKMTGKTYETKILKTFPNKRSAREYETNLIKRFRRMYGEDTLPGNKGTR